MDELHPQYHGLWEYGFTERNQYSFSFIMPSTFSVALNKASIDQDQTAQEAFKS